MHPVFGRNTLNYDSDLEAWLDGGCKKASPDREKSRALAFNVMRDRRVPPARETVFHEEYGSAQPLGDALVDYFKERVRRTSTPDFADTDLNEGNIVAGAFKSDRMDPDTALVTFLDLSGMRSVYNWAKAHPSEEYRKVFDVKGEIKEDEASGVLEGWFATWGLDETIRAILAAKSAYRNDVDNPAYHPTWAGLWTELDGEIASDNPDRWLELVGVLKSTGGRWIIPLKYTVFEAGTVARPTMLESCANPYHFPTPTSIPVNPGGNGLHGGCCMDLRTTPAAERLVHEYVHQEIDFTINHWLEAGARCRRTSAPGIDNIVAQRMAHHALLGKNWADVALWMPECV